MHLNMKIALFLSFLYKIILDICFYKRPVPDISVYDGNPCSFWGTRT